MIHHSFKYTPKSVHQIYLFWRYRRECNGRYLLLSLFLLFYSDSFVYILKSEMGRKEKIRKGKKGKVKWEDFTRYSEKLKTKRTHMSQSDAYNKNINIYSKIISTSNQNEIFAAFDLVLSLFSLSSVIQLEFDVTLPLFTLQLTSNQ